MNLLRKIFCKECSNTVDALKQENEDLKLKILEKQEQINKTNSYYKKKIHNMRKNPSDK